VYDPEELTTNNAFNIALDMFQSNSDGMGALAVYRNEDEGSFSYEEYAQAIPTWAEFLAFLEDVESEAWRVILHARLSTTGEDNDQNTHPLEVGEGSDFEWVVHNGVVSNHEQLRTAAERAGHEYATDVDSESIAHCVGSLPEDTDDIDERGEYNLQGSLNYILCNEDGIFVKNTGKYEWSDNFTVTTCRRDTSFDGASSSNRWLLVDPEDGVETVTWRDSSNNPNVSGRHSGQHAYYRGNPSASGGWQERAEESEESFQSSDNDGSVDAGSVNVEEEDLPDDFGAIYAENGDLLAWWDENDPQQKHTTDYEQYKEQYGSDFEDRVTVSSEELGMVIEPDDRVPDHAIGAYVYEEEMTIEWWNMEGDDGSVDIGEVITESEVVSSGNRSGGKKLEDLETANKRDSQKKKKSGNESAKQSGAGHSEEAVEMWNGHFGQ